MLAFRVMEGIMIIFDDDGDLPDGAFTADELAAGIQYLERGDDRGYLDDETYDYDTMEDPQTILAKKSKEEQRRAKILLYT